MEKCEDCSSEAEYICICLEEHLCSECLIDHITHSSSLNHRTVSLSHPLLSLLTENDSDSEDFSEEDQKGLNFNIKILEDFRDKCIQLIDSKIQVLQDQEVSETQSPILMKSSTPMPTQAIRLSNEFLNPGNNTERNYRTFETQITGSSSYVPGSIMRNFTHQNRETASYSYKVFISGGSKVGKSCIISSFKHIHEGSTDSISLVFRGTGHENLRVNLEITESRFGDFSDNALGALVVFDLTSRESLAEAEEIINTLERTNPVLGVTILVGTRLDLVVSNPNKRIASFANIQKFAINRKILYDEISAVNYTHVEELFLRLIRELYKKSNSLN